MLIYYILYSLFPYTSLFNLCIPILIRIKTIYIIHIYLHHVEVNVLCTYYNIQRIMNIIYGV